MAFMACSVLHGSSARCKPMPSGRVGFFLSFGGGGGIRTHGPRERTPVFKTGAFNRSATPPGVRIARASYCKVNARSSGLAGDPGAFRQGPVKTATCSVIGGNFMDFWHGFAVITVVHLLAAASPGPDFAYVTRQ